MMKKNPFMSLWLSGANAWMGSAHGLWAAEVHRQQAQLMNEMMRQTMRFWTGALMIPPAEGKSRRR